MNDILSYCGSLETGKKMKKGLLQIFDVDLVVGPFVVLQKHGVRSMKGLLQVNEVNTTLSSWVTENVV